MNIQARDGFGKYLGLQADFGHSKKAVFESVRRGIGSRIDGWAEQFLSPAGKEVLIKSVAMAMPNHAMACFKLPVGTCKELEQVISQFWWRGQSRTKGCHWVAWDKMTMSKKCGGLGFRDLICFNLAMLAKISWRVLHNPTSVLGQLLRDKYFPATSFLEANRRNKSSWGWKGILLGRQVLLRGLRWRVGNGLSIHAANDPWLPKPHTFRPMRQQRDVDMLVQSLIDPVTKEWKIELVTELFKQEDVEIIRAIPISHSGCEDRRIWHYTKNGLYTVKSGYFVALEMMKNGEFGRKGGGMSSSPCLLDGLWQKTWKVMVPKKLRLFLWRACRHSLAVRHNLERRRIRVKNICELCGAADETEAHIFFNCDFSRAFWFGTSLQIDMSSPVPLSHKNRSQHL